MASCSTKEDITFLQLLQDKYLECSLCIGDYRQPKSLACLHTFCLGCLQDFVKHNPGDIVCPTCRDITPIPKDGVQGLKNNFMIKALTDEAVLFKNQSVKCDSCEDGGNIATMVCVECAHYLCSTCYKGHQTVKAIRENHNTFEVKKLADIVNLREFQKNRFSTCKIHKEPMRLFCQTENIQLCHTCAFASTHKGHNISPLQEQLDILVTQIEALLSKCNVDEAKVKEENENLKELVDVAKQTEKKSIADIDKEEKQMEQESEIYKKLANSAPVLANNWFMKIVTEKYKALREEIKKSSEETITSCENKIEKNNALVKSYESKVVEKDGLQMIPISLCIEAAEGVSTGLKEMMKKSVSIREGSDEQKLKRFESKRNVGDDISVGGAQYQYPVRKKHHYKINIRNGMITSDSDEELNKEGFTHFYLELKSEEEWSEEETSEEEFIPTENIDMKASVSKREGSDEQKMKRFESKRNIGDDVSVGGAQCQYPGRNIMSSSESEEELSEKELIPIEHIDITRPYYRNGRNVNVGDRVRRGPDWHHGNQDGGLRGIGAVTHILATGARTKIKWDNGNVFIYRMGEEIKYELQLVE